jgi:hypothetical protein
VVYVWKTGQEEINGDIKFRVDTVEIIDSLLTQIQRRFESVCKVSSDFSFLHGDTLCSLAVKASEEVSGALCEPLIVSPSI